jgi:polar amino acid transport system substrate-binding protein
MEEGKLKNYLKIFMVTLLISFIAVSSVSAIDKLVFSTFENAGMTLVQEPVMREVYKRLGYEIEVRQFPGERAIHWADKGIFDGELARLMVVQEMYKNLRLVPTPIHEIKEVVFTKDADFTPRGWESLKPFSTVSLIGYKYTEKKLKEHKISYHMVPKFEQILRTVNAGRYDIGLLIMLDGLKTIKDKGIKGLRVLEPPLEIFPTYHFLHKKNEALIPKVNKTLKELKKEGFIKKIEAQVLLELTTE